MMNDEEIKKSREICKDTFAYRDWIHDSAIHYHALRTLPVALDTIVEMRERIEKLRRLAEAVQSSEFEGVLCQDVNGKNWFDEREEYLK